MNPQKDKDVHFIQMWVPPDTERINPSYEQLDINRELERGGLIPIASGRGHEAAISIKQEGAVLGVVGSRQAKRCRFPMSLMCICSLPRGVLNSKGSECSISAMQSVSPRPGRGA